MSGAPRYANLIKDIEDGVEIGTMIIRLNWNLFTLAEKNTTRSCVCKINVKFASRLSSSYAFC